MHIQKIGLFFAAVCVQVIYSETQPLVELPTGYILGRKAVSSKNTSYFSFEGIPYAAPPIGKLRFKPPQPPEKWSDIRDTTVSINACYQIGQHILPIESEDCLYLSVHTPTLPGFEDELLPVMVFIHGGAFVTGTGYLYRPDNFVDNDVILVTVNYRLGVFGFLSTEDDVVHGNNGLKDQLLAIQWTKNNIHLFGGDPDKITIFGESAGSASVAYHLLHQESEGLFRGAIMQSGSFLSPWAFQRNAKQIAYETASILDPKLDENLNTDSLIEFLQSVNASDLNKAAEEYYARDKSEELAWAPIIEIDNSDAFLTEKMYDSLKVGNILKVPIIIGINSEESLYFHQDPDETKMFVSNYDKNLDTLVPNDMQIIDFDNRTELGCLIREIYTNGEPFADNVGDGIRYASDNSFTRSVIKHAEIYSNLADTYFYQFSHDGVMGGITVKYEGAEKVGHAEDLFYLFCLLTCNAAIFPESDILTSERMVKLWTNFAKYQNPTPEKSDILQNVIWPKVSTENGDFLYLDIGDDLEIKNHPKEETYKAWVDLYNSLEKNSFDTY